MGTKTIPQLTELTAFVDTNALIPVDDTTQTYKMKVGNIASEFARFQRPAVNTTKVASFSPTVTDEGCVFRLNSSGGAFNVNLPNPTTMAGRRFRFKDITGYLGTYAVTLVRFSTEKIENLQANFAMEANYGNWSLFCDGTDWMFE